MAEFKPANTFEQNSKILLEQFLESDRLLAEMEREANRQRISRDNLKLKLFKHLLPDPSEKELILVVGDMKVRLDKSHQNDSCWTVKVEKVP